MEFVELRSYNSVSVELWELHFWAKFESQLGHQRHNVGVKKMWVLRVCGQYEVVFRDCVLGEVLTGGGSSVRV